MRYVCTSALAHVCAPFPYLGNGWTGCTEIWYVFRDQLARQLTFTLARSSPKRRLTAKLKSTEALPSIAISCVIVVFDTYMRLLSFFPFVEVEDG